MYLSAISPSRTPSKSGNVERLLSLQKSAKHGHLSDADILSVAADASAIKRQARISSNLENIEPNRTLPRRLFDIGECSKNATGSYYSPEKTEGHTTENTTDSNHLETQEEEGSDSDSDSDSAEDALQLAEKHFAEILQIVDKASGAEKLARSRAKKAALQASFDLKHSNHSLSENTQHTELQESHTFDDYGHAFEYGYGSDASGVETSSLGGSGNCDVGAVVTASGIKDLVVKHILTILNTGTMEEILSLHGIGQVRALRILTQRNAGCNIVSLEDLADVTNMNDKTLLKFLKANAAHIMS